MKNPESSRKVFLTNAKAEDTTTSDDSLIRSKTNQVRGIGGGAAGACVLAGSGAPTWRALGGASRTIRGHVAGIGSLVIDDERRAVTRLAGVPAVAAGGIVLAAVAATATVGASGDRS